MRWRNRTENNRKIRGSVLKVLYPMNRYYKEKENTGTAEHEFPV